MLLQPQGVGARILRACLAGSMLLALASLQPVGAASAAGLFEGMAGSWRGEGSLKWSTGENERMRCTAKYEVTQEGNKLVQNLTCATDSTRLVVTSDITYKPAAGVITGSWSEKGYGISGWVSGTASVGTVKARVESADKSFYADVNLLTQGAEQVVTIIPKNLEVTEVFVTMRRT